MNKRLFHDEEGFSTVGMVVALLVTLALVFSSAQIYQVNSAAATIQNVADAAALSAENEVAEFYIVAHVCDAIILSLSLTGIAAYGIGIAALCTPVTTPYAETFLKAGSDIFKARNNFAEKAAAGLNTLQKLLPFFAAANAASVVSANSGGSMNASYVGIAILLPFEGKEITVGPTEASEELEEKVAEEKEDLQEAGKEAEEAAKEANAEKEKAFQADCGAAPDYCMYERAERLAILSPQENPLYTTSETWDFSVALKRAQAYYPSRLAVETPVDNSLESQADSALRKRFYAYAIAEIEKGYVHEDEENFDAHFPLLPKNTTEMKGTPLYTEVVYPKTENASGEQIMHAWSGCPGMTEGSSRGLGSISEMDSGGFKKCASCEFSVTSFGKIAAASTSIQNGFEHHYRIVAEAAAAYEKARKKYSPHAEEVKTTAGELFEKARKALEEAISYRFEVKPPGRFGSISMVANLANSPTSTNFANLFVNSDSTLGTQAAISAATLVPDSSEEGESVISSFLDNVSNESSCLDFGLANAVLDLWSFLLSAYTKGQESLEEGIKKAIEFIPFASESGLGIWAANAFSKLIETIGLQPANLEALKPVLVNSAHVLTADDSGFARQILQIKCSYLALYGSGSGDIFSTAVSQIEGKALESIEGLEGEIVIASIEFLGEGGPSIPITIPLPSSAMSVAGDLISSVADTLRGITSSCSGLKRWE